MKQIVRVVLACRLTAVPCSITQPRVQGLLRSPRAQQGFIGAGLVVGLLMAAVIVGVLGTTALTISRSTSAVQTRNTTSQLAQQTLYALAQQVNISGGMTAAVPVAGSASHPQDSSGGLLVPDGSGGALRDSVGTPFVYCPYDNKNATPANGFVKGSAPPTGATPVLALIGAGPDRIFQTSCETARTTSAAAAGSDDLVRVMNGQQIVQGTGGTKFFGDPVKTVSDLGSILSPSAGELRVVTDTGETFVNPSGTTGSSKWQKISGSGGGGTNLYANVSNLPGSCTAGATAMTEDTARFYICNSAKAWQGIAVNANDVVSSSLSVSPASPSIVAAAGISLTATSVVTISGGLPPYTASINPALDNNLQLTGTGLGATGAQLNLASISGTKLPKTPSTKTHTIVVVDAAGTTRLARLTVLVQTMPFVPTDVWANDGGASSLSSTANAFSNSCVGREFTTAQRIAIVRGLGASLGTQALTSQGACSATPYAFNANNPLQTPAGGRIVIDIGASVEVSQFRYRPSNGLRDSYNILVSNSNCGAGNLMGLEYWNSSTLTWVVAATISNGTFETNNACETPVTVTLANPVTSRYFAIRRAGSNALTRQFEVLP